MPDIVSTCMLYCCQYLHAVHCQYLHAVLLSVPAYCTAVSTCMLYCCQYCCQYLHVVLLSVPECCTAVSTAVSTCMLYCCQYLSAVLLSVLLSVLRTATAAPVSYSIKKQKPALCSKRNIKARQCNCCCVKAMNITYCECLFVALGMQHAMRMCHIVICGLLLSAIFFHLI